LKRLYSFLCIGFLIAGPEFVIGQSYIPEIRNPKFKIKPAVPIKAYAFHPRQVKLLDGSLFKRAQDLDGNYLQLLEPARLLHRFHRNAGLQVQAEVYGGWESEGVSGHTLGHYLSAASLFYLNTGNPIYKSNIDYIMLELDRCQRARKSGYVGAIPQEDSIFAKVRRGEIKSSGFDLNGGWSPWYTVHKLMAGLLDTYLYAENEMSLQIVIKMADWIDHTISHLSDSVRFQMLRCEFGGMNEVLAQLYGITGNKKYLALSYKFYDDFVMKPLAQKIDPMPGKHSNTNVPKAIGSAVQYELTGNPNDHTIADFFWNTMVHHHSYVIGGNSSYEYCGDPDKLNDRLSDNTCETCNTYNMLKLTRHLHAWQPDSRFMDYYERALYNHILASQHPESGMMCYFVPLRMGTTKEFSDSFKTFTCCVGTGIENHAKYNEAIYSEGSDGSLWVNLFIPSELNWPDKKTILRMETRFPEDGTIKLLIQPRKKTFFPLHIRKPWWARTQPVIYLNDQEIPAQHSENGYLTIARHWKKGDRIKLEWPMTLYTEPIPDNPDRVAFLYGPIVLAGQLGPTIPDPVYGVPVLLTEDKMVSRWVQPLEKPLHFKTKGIGQPFDIELKPFYATYRDYYSVYWDFFTPEKWEQKKAAYEMEKRRLANIEARTIDYFRIGEMQPERDHRLEATERSYVSDALGVKGREARAGHSFRFEMAVLPQEANQLIFLFLGDDKKRLFDVFIDDKLFQRIDWPGAQANTFYPIEYAIPPDWTKAKSMIRLKIEANQGTTTARIFGVRTARKESD
jgi:uncharacterized protein